MTTLGQDLRRHREARGLPLEEIAASTKIGLRYLEALESDRYDLLPGAFFTRGIIRSYAAALGLDEDAVLEKFAAAGVVSPRREVIAPPSVDDIGGPTSRARLLIRAAAAFLVVAAVSAAGYFVLRPRAGGSVSATVLSAQTPPAIAPAEPETVAPVASSESPPANPTTAPAEGASPEPDRGAAPAAENAAAGLTLEISFVDLTWLQVYADGRPVVDGLKSAGESVLIEAEREILLHTGNAGGMALLLDGRTARPLGRPGQVVKNVRITPETARRFLADETVETP